MIKQIITTTTLIAASVVMANAALTLEAQYLLGEEGSFGQFKPGSQTAGLVDATNNGHNMAQWDGSNSKNTGEASPFAAKEGSTYSLKTNGQYAIEGNTVNNDGVTTHTSELFSLDQYIIRFDVKIGTNQPDGRLLWRTGPNGNDNANSFALGFQGGQLIFATNNGGSNFAQIGTESATLDRDVWTRILIYVDGNSAELYTSTDGINAGSALISTNDAAKPLEKMKFLAGTGTRLLQGENNFVDELRVYSFDLTGTTKEALIAQAIPEPSMFGLLAGLGALALVGARRRRRK